MLKFNSNIQSYINNHEIRDLQPTWVKSIDLLVPERLDLVIKYQLARELIMGNVSSFTKDLYFKHLRIINGFVESDSTGKIGKNDFYKAFSGLVDSVRDNGYDINEPIPISDKNHILDGAHRTAIALALGVDLPVISLDLKGHKYDYTFWKEGGLSEYNLEYIIHQYLLLKPEAHIAIIWPSAEKNILQLQKSISDCCPVVFKKYLSFSEVGKINIIRTLYDGEKWIGSSKNGFAGAKHKSESCFASGSNAALIVFEHQGDIFDFKKSLRTKQGLGKHAIHISEDKSEKDKIAKIILNTNSMHWVNFSKLVDNRWLFTLLADYKGLIAKSECLESAFCLAGSSVLAAYGLRTNRDIDYLSNDTGFLSEQKEIGICNKEYAKFQYNYVDIVDDPKSYFFFFGLKMQSILELRKFKKSRGENKDLDDIKLIDSLSTSQTDAIYLLEILYKVFSYYYWKGRIKFMLFKVRYYVFRLKSELQNSLDKK